MAIRRSGNQRRVNTRRNEGFQSHDWRNHPLARIVRLFGIYLVFVGIFMIWQEVAVWVDERRWFDLRTIDVIQAETVSTTEIIDYSRVKLGISIFDIDVKKVAAEVESHPWIKSALVSRRLPDALLIEVQEYQAVGLVQLDRLYYVDQDGTPFKVAPPEATNDYVIIHGLTADDFKPLDLGRSKVRSSLELMAVYRNHPLAMLAPLKSARFHHNGLELTVGEPSTTLVMGKNGTKEALDRANKLLKYLRAKGKNAEVIHLDNRKQPERISVRLDKPDSIEEEIGNAEQNKPY